MKSLVKPLLIAIAAIVVVGGILVFALSRFSPPKMPDEVDQYALDLEKDLKAIVASNSTAKMDSTFDVAIAKINIYNKEEKITPEKHDELASKVYTTYAGAVFGKCHTIFSRPEWSEKDVKWAKERLKVIDKAQLYYGSSPLNEPQLAELTKYTRVINDYEAAKKIVENSTFTTWEKASDAISNANRYLNDEYLKNNRELKEDLEDMAKSLHTSCYENLENQVKDLANYKSMTKSMFDNKLEKAQTALNDYIHNSPRVFGGANDVSNLQTLIQTYSQGAERYYSIPTIDDIFNYYYR